MVSSVCIFAHNEEKHLPRCIEALDGAAAGSDYVVHILENGSKDQTALMARAFSAADDRIHVHRLPIADKANAWNEYIHRIADPADIHIFIDADVVAWRGAFRAFALAFEASKNALGAAGLPTSGRSRRQWTARLFNDRCLSGNLYALSGKALDLMRAREIRMPIGLIGEDGLLSYLLRTDLKGGSEDAALLPGRDPLRDSERTGRRRHAGIYRGYLHGRQRRPAFAAPRLPELFYRPAGPERAQGARRGRRDVCRRRARNRVDELIFLKAAGTASPITALPRASGDPDQGQR
jgi:hypothetical protein